MRRVASQGFLRNTESQFFSGRELAVSKTWAILLVFALAAIPSRAQVPVAPSEIVAARQAVEAHQSRNSLDCFVNSWGPSLDFDFRYEAGFDVAISMKQVSPGEDLMTYLRVVPQGNAAVFLERMIQAPSATQDQAAAFLISGNRRRFQVTASGRFNVGEGKYSVELVVIDPAGRSCHQEWKMQTGKYPDRSVRARMEPGEVAPITQSTWDGRLAANGVRLSVLLDAAPVNPFSARMHADDRAFSMEALAALLREMPCQSVQIVAFNLEQQRDVFREENFDADGFSRLADALEKLQLSTVPVEALKRGNNIEYLRRLAREQVSSGQADAVVFVGPNLRRTYENPQMQPMESTSTRFFYLEGYTTFPAVYGLPPGVGPRVMIQRDIPFPDSIEYLTKELHGSVFHISSAKDLATAIPKMLAQLKGLQSSDSSSPGH
jgi:hypothetical protein